MPEPTQEIKENVESQMGLLPDSATSQEKQNVEQDVGAMLDALEQSIGAKDEPSAEEAVDAQETSEEEAANPEEPAAEVVEPTEPEESAEPEDEVTQLRNLVTELYAKLEAQGIPAQETPVETPTETPVEEVSTPVEPAAPVAEFKGDFLNGIDLEDALNDSDNFNKVLSNVASTTRQSIGQEVQKVLRSLPGIIQSVVVEQITLAEKSRDFYAGNRDLEQFKPVVTSVARELASKNPDWTVDKLYEELGNTVRKKLVLSQGAVDPVRETSPGFTRRGTTTRREKPSLSKLQSDIDAMNKVIA